ncbi:hypothetical protein F4677DRAFT_445345 [Hypoxylon crocopeplum]|nr:hypothetical protein F4677DRAFT_445345 [Hypoxylon crocopeplum]
MVSPTIITEAAGRHGKYLNISNYSKIMCWWRRVFFTCGHEDADVTPPRSVKPCDNAIRTGSIQEPNYCSETGRVRTPRRDSEGAEWRERPCIPCEKRRLREDLDGEWNAFVGESIYILTEPEMTSYIERRDEIFDLAYYWDWAELHTKFLDTCKEDVENK